MRSQKEIKGLEKLSSADLEGVTGGSSSKSGTGSAKQTDRDNHLGYKPLPDKNNDTPDHRLLTV